MKIGIITFYCSHNYGAMLQTYGLQEYLKGIGHEVYIIDFKPKYKLKQYKKNDFRAWFSRNPIMCIKRLFNYIRYKKTRNARWNGFNTFMKQRFSLYPFKNGEDFHDFDAIFIGSDQVWSSYHTGGKYDDIMFGVGFKCKAISYAASCTVLSLNKYQIDYFKKHLDWMTAISVREEGFKNVLQPLTKHNISVVLDPTLLAGRIVYDRIASTIIKEKPYILVYEISPHQEVYRLALSMAEQLNTDIVELTNGMQNYHRETMDEGASPEKFLGYFKNAACIITTSFHGTAFSILFERPFYTVLQGTAADIRMTSLLSQIGLYDRLIKKDKMPVFSIPNFKHANNLLTNSVKFSEEFISKSLQD